MNKYIGIDIGKTKTAIGLFSEKCDVLLEIKISTPDNANDIINMLKEQLNLLTEKNNINAIGIATTGIVDSKKGLVVDSSLINGWKNVELGSIIENEFNIPTFIANDLVAGAICEINNLKGVNTYISLGTSMAVTTIIDGKILYGHNGLAGVVAYLRDLYCDYVIDDYITGDGIAKRITMAKGIDISTEEFFLLLENKDSDAIKIYNEALKCMVNLLKWVSAILNPGKIVLGGGVITKQSQLFDDIKREYINDLSREHSYMGQAVIEKSKYGEQSAMIGACILCMNKISYNDN